MTYGINPPIALEAGRAKDWCSTVFREFETRTRGVAVTAAYTVPSDVCLVRADATSGAFTVTLPPAEGNFGRDVLIIKSDSSANAVKVGVSGSDVLGGVTTQALASQYSAILCHASGTGTWDVVTSNLRDIFSLLDVGGVGDGTTSNVTPFASAVTQARTIYVPKGTWLIDSNTTVSAGSELWFENGAKISVASGVTFTYAGYTLRAPRTQIFTGDGTVLLTGLGEIEVVWFGADPSATNDSTTAIQKAITCAQNSGRLANVVLGVGIFTYSSQLTTLTGSGVSIVGVPESALQQGLIRPCSTLRWTGGASKTIELNCTRMSFRHLSFENTGTATDLFDITVSGSGHFTMHRCTVASGSSAGIPPATKPYTASVFSGHRPNYSEISYCEFVGAAPKIWSADGTGESNGITTLYWFRNHVTSYFDQVSIYVKNSSYDVVTVEKCTYDMQATGAYWSGLGYSYAGLGNCIIDTSDCNDDATGKDISNLVIKELEWDCDNLTLTTARVGVLHRCRSVKVEDMQITGASDQVAGFDLTEGTTAKSDNVRFINLDDLFVPDSTSYAWDGTSNPRTLGAGIVPDSTTSGIIALTASSGNVDISPHYGHKLKDTTFRFTDTTGGTNYTIRYLDRTSTPPSYATRGQKITVEIVNDSNTAMGTVTFNSSFRLHGPFDPPADECSRFIRFEWDGTYWQERGRSHFDIGASTNKLIDDGAYTPTATAVANVDASTTYETEWLRVGSRVTVSGLIDIDATAATTATTIRITLPVASDLTASQQCRGTVTASLGLGYGLVTGDTTNNAAVIQVWPTGTTNTSYSFHFTYRIL